MKRFLKFNRGCDPKLKLGENETFCLQPGHMRIKGRTRTQFLLLLSSIAFLVCSHQVNSHEPVTTKVRFNKEVIRIFRDHCVACHRPGSTTDISLDTYLNARPWAKAFKEEILERRMPPFQTARGFGNFENDYQLTQHEIDLIVSWVDGGTPKGEDKDLPSTDAVELKTPDLLLSPKKTMSISAGEGDEYRCVSLPTNLKQTRSVSGIKFIPGNEAILHCASIGFGSDSDGCDKAQTAYAWFPGEATSSLPSGVGRLLKVGNTVWLKLHFRKTKEEKEDRSSVGLFFSQRKVQKSLQTISLFANGIEVPANAQDFRIESSYTIDANAEAVAIRPLLFPFAKSVEVSAFRPDGSSEVLIWASDYRYDWQPEYRFKKEISLPRGTRIRTVAYLDNSNSNPNNPNSPARRVHFNTPLCELSLVSMNKRVQ